MLPVIIPHHEPVQVRKQTDAQTDLIDIPWGGEGGGGAGGGGGGGAEGVHVW